MYEVQVSYDLRCDAADCDGHRGMVTQVVGRSNPHLLGATVEQVDLPVDAVCVELSGDWFVVRHPDAGPAAETRDRHFCSANCLAWYYDPANVDGGYRGGQTRSAR